MFLGYDDWKGVASTRRRKSYKAFGLILERLLGRVDLDSNTVERAIRPLALNRKNALFAGSDEGGDNWAVIATLIEKCKISGINPHAWLTGTLTKLANNHLAKAVSALMPWTAVA